MLTSTTTLGIRKEEHEMGTVILDCAVQLPQALGLGLLETVTELTMARRVESAGVTVPRQAERDDITRITNGNLCTTSVSQCPREKPGIEQGEPIRAM